MKVKRKWALMGLCVALVGAILTACSQPAEEKYTEGVGHDANTLLSGHAYPSLPPFQAGVPVYHS